MNVFEFMEKVSRKDWPQVLTVKRTQVSKHLFYLLVRHYSKTLKIKPKFFTYTKKDFQNTRGLLEEVSLFISDEIYVLEGFSYDFVSSLSLPSTVYLLAETDNGLLEAPPYSYRDRRGIIRFLRSYYELQYPLRSLLSLDWSYIKSYADIEVFLRRASILGWSIDEMSNNLVSQVTGSVLILLKKGKYTDLISLRESQGSRWMLKVLLSSISSLTSYRSLISLGHSPTEIGEIMNLSSWRVSELENISSIVSSSDIVTLANRIIYLDKVFLSKPEEVIDLLILKSGMSVRL